MADYPTGVARVESGDCPLGAFTPMGCMFCPYGHALECHYPYECEEAACSHYQEQMAAEPELYPPEIIEEVSDVSEGDCC